MEASTTSPSKNLAFAWHVPNKEILPTTEENELRGDDSLRVYLINPQTFHRIAKMKSVGKYGYFNHFQGSFAVYSEDESLAVVDEENDWGVVSLDAVDTKTGHVTNLFGPMLKAVQKYAVTGGPYSSEEAKKLAYEGKLKLEKGILTLNGTAEIPKGDDPHNGIDVMVEYAVVEKHGNMTVELKSVEKGTHIAN